MDMTAVIVIGLLVGFMIGVVCYSKGYSARDQEIDTGHINEVEMLERQIRNAQAEPKTARANEGSEIHPALLREFEARREEIAVSAAPAAQRMAQLKLLCEEYGVNVCGEKLRPLEWSGTAERDGA